MLPYAVCTTVCTQLLGTSYTESDKRLTNGVLISILLNSVHTHDWVVDFNWHIPALYLKVLVELLPAHLKKHISANSFADDAELRGLASTLAMPE